MRTRPREPRDEDEILTSREAQALLKIGRTKLWELTRKNLIPAYRLGDGTRASLRFKRSELLAWLDQNRVWPRSMGRSSVPREKGQP